jgi:hypothetical protein
MERFFYNLLRESYTKSLKIGLIIGMYI